MIENICLLVAIFVISYLDDEGDLRSESIKETYEEFPWIEVELEIYESERWDQLTMKEYKLSLERD